MEVQNYRANSKIGICPPLMNGLEISPEWQKELLPLI